MCYLRCSSFVSVCNAGGEERIWSIGGITDVEGNQSTLRIMYSSALSSTTNPMWSVLGKNLFFLRATTAPLSTSGSCNEQEPSAVMEFALHVVILRSKLFEFLLMLHY